MDQLNDAAAAQVSSLYMGEYGDAMMALITQHEVLSDGASVTASVPLKSLFSAAEILQADKLHRQSVSPMPNEHTAAAAVSLSSLPLVKTEGGFPNISNRFEFHRAQAEKSFTESASMQVICPTVTSLASQEISPHFSRTSTATATDEEDADAMKAKILGHPQYRCLLDAYINCQKVGAPPEVVARLDAVGKEHQIRTTTSIGMNPELDRFMESYCEMLNKYQEDLAKPFKESMAFFKKIETELNSMTKATIRISPSAESDEKTEEGGSSDDENCSTAELDHTSEDTELKERLLRKYSGYLSNLKQEFMKKKKKGKLPKDARQKLLDWWNLHYKWPYPSETEKAALAESAGLDQKQINNWFINQRKRHWKPSEDMPFVVMDTHSPHGSALYMPCIWKD